MWSTRIEKHRDTLRVARAIYDRSNSNVITHVWNAESALDVHQDAPARIRGLHGVLELSSNGQFKYYPDSESHEPDLFQFRTNSGKVCSLSFPDCNLIAI